MPPLIVELPSNKKRRHARTGISTETRWYSSMALSRLPSPNKGENTPEKVSESVKNDPTTEKEIATRNSEKRRRRSKKKILKTEKSVEPDNSETEKSIEKEKPETEEGIEKQIRKRQRRKERGKTQKKNQKKRRSTQKKIQEQREGEWKKEIPKK